MPGDGEKSDVLRTHRASRAMDAASTFAGVLGTSIPGWKAELATPGISTEGGKQAVQHIGLSSPEGRTLVVGSVDWARRRVEMRPYLRVAGTHEHRFGSPFPVSAADYDAFLSRVAEFFRPDGFSVGAEGGSLAPEHPRRFPVLWIVLGVAFVIAVGVLAGVLR